MVGASLSSAAFTRLGLSTHCAHSLLDAGWFTEPTPFFSGGLSAEEAGVALDNVMEDVLALLGGLPQVTGDLSNV